MLFYPPPKCTVQGQKMEKILLFDNPAPHLCRSSISSPELWFVGTGRDCLWRVGGGATSTSDSHLLPASLPQLAAACKHSQRRHHTFPPPLTTPTSQNMAKCAALKYEQNLKIFSFCSMLHIFYLTNCLFDWYVS